MRSNVKGRLPLASQLRFLPLVILVVGVCGQNSRWNLPVHAAPASTGQQGAAVSGLCATLGQPICTAFTGIFNAAGSFLKPKEKSTLDTQAKQAVGPVVKLGESLGVFRMLLLRSYDARPHLEEIRSLLLRPQPDVTKLSKKEADGFLDAYWAPIQAEWGQLSPYLVDLKGTDKHEIENLFTGVHSEKVKTFVEDLVEAHLHYYAAIDTAIRTKNQAWLQKQTDGLGQLLASGGPAAAAVFSELKDDTAQLSAWASQTGKVAKGSGEKGDHDKTRSEQIIDGGLKVPDPSHP